MPNTITLYKNLIANKSGALSLKHGLAPDPALVTPCSKHLLPPFVSLNYNGIEGSSLRYKQAHRCELLTYDDKPYLILPGYGQVELKKVGTCQTECIKI